MLFKKQWRAATCHHTIPDQTTNPTTSQHRTQHTTRPQKGNSRRDPNDTRPHHTCHGNTPHQATSRHNTQLNATPCHAMPERNAQLGCACLGGRQPAVKQRLYIRHRCRLLPATSSTSSTSLRKRATLQFELRAAADRREALLATRNSIHTARPCCTKHIIQDVCVCPNSSDASLARADGQTSKTSRI